MKSRICSLIILNLSFIILGCAPEETVLTDSNGRISITYSGPNEVSYCSSVRTFSNSVTISGTAVYQKRELIEPPDLNDPVDGGLGEASSDLPVRRAEVRITDTNNVEIQCGETDASGNFSINLPKSRKQYKLWVNARANNNYMKVSVLNRPEKNTVYSLSTLVVADSTKSIGTLRATVDGKILGAAFYMLDLVLDINDFLRTELSNCDTQVDQCTNFTVAPKVSIYWEAGFNPNYYFGANSSGRSLYLPSYSRLFILGGISGDTSRSDTDHFDPTIIVHEYAHFIEDVLGDTDSPGGDHYADRQIDPRLAWSEGFANAFQAMVLDYPYYVDTIGNIDGCTTANVNDCTDFIVFIPIETAATGCGVNDTGCDKPVVANEGNFREFAITRFLYDLIDTDNDGESITNGFAELWTALTSSTVGLKRSAYKFRDIGLLAFIQDTMLTQSSGSSPINDWSTARSITENRILAERTEYAQYVEADSTTCSTARNFTMTPFNDTNDNGGFSRPNWHRNNDFYHYKHNGGSLTLTLNYQGLSGTCNDNLDIYIYDSDARYGESGDIVAKSTVTPNTTATSLQTESTPATNLPAGDYLINVKLTMATGSSGQCGASRVSGGNVEYEILATGGRLCPKTLP